MKKLFWIVVLILLVIAARSSKAQDYQAKVIVTEGSEILFIHERTFVERNDQGMEGTYQVVDLFDCDTLTMYENYWFSKDDSPEEWYEYLVEVLQYPANRDIICHNW